MSAFNFLETVGLAQTLHSYEEIATNYIKTDSFAYCTSRSCCMYQVTNSVTKRTNTKFLPRKEKFVSKYVTSCPDCGHVLKWVTRRA